MQVEQINSQISQGLALGKVNRQSQTAEETPESQPQPETSATLSDEVESIEQSARQGSDDTKTEGVLRLLQEGHFKGVADVRLRINFHDELAAIEGEQLGSAANENISTLTESVGPGTQTLVDSGQITQQQADEATTTFQQGANQAVNDFLTGQISSGEGLAAQLQSVFNDFIVLLTAGTTQATAPEQPPADVITPEQPAEDTAPEQSVPEQTEQSSPAEPVDGTTPAEVTGDTTIPEVTLEQSAEQETVTEQAAQEQPGEPATFVEELTTAFNAVVEQFLNTINSVKVLPELSPPSGNGAAYQKFLEIYNQLYGLTTESTSADTVSLDTIT